MEYRSQKIAYWYFAAALPLFVLQVLVGLWLAANYTFTIPQSIVDVLPFSTARAIHTNLLVLWMLLGFMGGTYYIIPEETKSELYSTNLAWFQLIALLATGVTAIVGFLFGWTQGRPLLEIPMELDFVVVVGALVFLFNVGMTMFKAKNWTAIQGTLLGGLVFLALLYLFGMPFYRNLVIDWYYWWWVIHLWVEGAWELVTAAIFAFVLMKLTGVERQVVEKWLYVEIGLFLFTGIVGITFEMLAASVKSWVNRKLVKSKLSGLGLSGVFDVDVIAHLHWSEPWHLIWGCGTWLRPSSPDRCQPNSRSRQRRSERPGRRDG